MPCPERHHDRVFPYAVVVGGSSPACHGGLPGSIINLPEIRLLYTGGCGISTSGRCGYHVGEPSLPNLREFGQQRLPVAEVIQISEAEQAAPPALTKRRVMLVTGLNQGGDIMV